MKKPFEEVAERGGWLLAQALIDPVQCFIIVVGHVIQVAQVEICGGIVGVQADGMLKLSFGGVIESFVQVGGTEIVAGGIKVGSDLQSFS